ncbi:MAG TPA: ATP-binding protein [Fulvivirga sp.]|nr:ATP-binding protein [Fulvivirga sp.]
MGIIKNFRVNVIFRILLISALLLLLTWVLSNKPWFFTPLVIGIVLTILIFNLIAYVERTNRNIVQFLASIKQGGFTNLFKGKSSGGTHAALNEAFNEVMLQFQQLAQEKESHYQYLQTLNENIGVSLISYNSEGKIELMNPAAKILLQKPFINKIDDLALINQQLHGVITSLESEEKRVIKTVIHGDVLQLSVQVKDFIAQEKQYRLVLIQNIHHELEEKEVEAWQKLMSVLTHEIMNSVTPIASLSTAINQQLNLSDTMGAEDFDDLKISLETIENRSKGLMRFVNAYKEFSKTPELSIAEVDLKLLIERILQLLSPDLTKADISVKVDFNRLEKAIKIDEELIEQVVINLLKNSIEALESTVNGKITIVGEIVRRTTMLKISDNGAGIAPENLDKIFIPFFTTKKKGTGVGLSFARKVMRLHNGNIRVHSKMGEGTSFILEFG